MWCETQKNGTVVYRERYTNPLTLKVERVAVAYPKDTPQNKNKAQRELNAKIEAAIKEFQCTDNTVTLTKLQKEYLKAQRIIYKDSTVDRNESVTGSVIEILNPDAIVNNLTAQYVKSKLLESKSNIKTLNSYITRFKAMLNWGYENDYHDNMRLITKLKQFDDSSEDNEITTKYLEPEESKKLLEYIKHDNCWHWYYTTSILLLTGLRFGELSALEVSDVDLDQLTIRISKTYDSKHDSVTTPKTDNSKRVIHIQPALLVELKKCMLWRKELMFANNFRSNILIPNNKGDHMQIAGYEKYLRVISEKLFERRVTPHMLRHTHASLLAANGMTPEEIARRLGHGKSEITREIYIHVTKKVTQNDNQKLDQINLFS